MLLSADGKLPVQSMGRLSDGRDRVAAPECVIVLHARAGDKRICNRHRRGLRLDVDLCETRGPAGLVTRAGDDSKQRLAVENDFPVGEQRLVGEYRGDVVFARNIPRCENGHDAWRGADRRRG